jgi:hypothetical protein
MTEQIALNLSSACFGFMAAVYFCVGSAFTNKKKIVAISMAYYGYNLDFAKATTSQSTQYAIGGLLLIVSFLLQVVATQASTTNLIIQNPTFLQTLCLVVLLSLCIGLLTLCFYKLTIKYRFPKIKEEIQKLLNKT